MLTLNTIPIIVHMAISDNCAGGIYFAFSQFRLLVFVNHNDYDIDFLWLPRNNCLCQIFGIYD